MLHLEPKTGKVPIGPYALATGSVPEAKERNVRRIWLVSSRGPISPMITLRLFLMVFPCKAGFGMVPT